MISNMHVCLLSLKTLVLILSTANSETTQVRDALVQFMAKLSPSDNNNNNGQREPNFGWNATSDPCNNAWKGVFCYPNSVTIKKIMLEELNFTGTLDAASLCTAKSLAVLSLSSNGIAGVLPEELSECGRLTHIYLHGNRFSGNLPKNLSSLSKLKRLDISENGFSGDIPEGFSRISGLLTFLAQNNRLSGVIPNLDFSNLEEFNVSNNELTGPIPDGGARFNETGFLGNPGLCGKPLPNACPPLPPSAKKSSSKKNYFIYTGYALIGLIIVSLLSLKLIKKRASKNNKNGFKTDRKNEKISSSTSSDDPKANNNRSEFSITSAESGRNSSQLVVLSNPVANELKFEDLLRSPAELIGRGRKGSVYKVTVNEAVTLAVKRIRDWEITKDGFRKRMTRMDRVKHRNVMPVVAFYCSTQEKLLVYEFKEGGSLFSLLHGSKNGQSFGWESRLNVASKIAEALAFMHEALQPYGIAHGNLKSSNILLTKEAEPLISEYGLAESDYYHNQESNSNIANNNNDIFQADIYSFGIILLELLTGRIVQNNGFELAMWVNSAMREEWTVEIFDKGLVSEGASEERMVDLLHVALKCISGSYEERPSVREVACMINSIKENEEKSMVYDP
ncbi:hypothetical protein ACP275_04G172000 [Erythranthe tilingii]